MAFILPAPKSCNSPIRTTPFCAQHTTSPKTLHTISVAAAGIAAAGLVASANLAEAFELPQLPLPPLPSISIPGLPELPSIGGEQRPKDSPTDLSQEEAGRVEDMMSKLDAKRKERAAKM